MSRTSLSNRDSSSNRSIYVRHQLQRLDFKSFQRVIWLWLGACGYQQLRTLSRSRQRGRGSVGPDFLVQVGDDGLEVAVQVRHWKTPISKRAVDELRGILLRDAIPAGMIISPSTASRAACTAAAGYSGRPIRLIGLNSLAESMIALDLGDAAFFRSIQAMSLGIPMPVEAQRCRRTVPAEVTFQQPVDPDPITGILAGLLLGLLILWLVLGLPR